MKVRKGSRAMLIVCRDGDVARERFGILEDEDGICYQTAPVPTLRDGCFRVVRLHAEIAAQVSGT